MNNEVTAFLPCRKGSERIPNKNVKKFSIYENGLLELKLGHLFECSEINEIILSTNDERIMDIGKKISKQRNYTRLIIDERPDELGSSSTSTDKVIEYVAKKFSFEHLLWTHVTSPFVDSADYSICIEKYFQAVQNGYDSLMTVQSFQGFFWDSEEPITYDRSLEKWPRTQTIKKIYEIDSAAFLASQNVYRNSHDRIGKKPLLLDLEKKFNIDIDWPYQFEMAEIIFNHSLSK